MTKIILVRHGRTTANAAGVLAGWSPGVHLDETGERQARELAARLAPVPVVRIVSSPLERTVETARILQRGRGVKISRDRRFGECDYGTWTGRKINTLARDPLWRTVQSHPSAVTFPHGEAMSAMAQRAVQAVRQLAATTADSSQAAGCLLVVTHADIIKAVLADALGMHLDMFQRITVDPGSISVIDYTPLRPFVERINDTGGEVRGLMSTTSTESRKRGRRQESDAIVGGGAGAG